MVCFWLAINNIGYLGTGTDLGGTNTYDDFYEFSPDSLQDSVLCLTLKPNSDGGKDIHVLSGLPNTNVDPHQEFVFCGWTCQGSPCNDRALIQFNMSVIPANATLISATLGLHANPSPIVIPTANYGSNNAFLIRRVTSPWSESTVTWNTQPTTTTQNEVLVPQSTSSGQSYLNLDVTALVNDMRNDPQNSFGFMMRLVNEIPYNGRDFASSDHPDSTKWPSITYCFIIPTGINNLQESQAYFKVTPTVFTDKISVEFLALSKKVQFEILDISGKVIFRKVVDGVPNKYQKLDVYENECSSALRNGVYLVRLISNDIVMTKRIVRLN